MKKNLQSRQIVLFLGDLFLFFLSLIITLILGFGNNLTLRIFYPHLYSFLFLLPFWLIIFVLSNLYDLTTLIHKDKLFLYSFIQIPLIFSTGTIFFYLFSPFGLTPKTNLLIFSLVYAFFFWFWRTLFLKITAKHFHKKVILIGKGTTIEKLHKALENNPSLGYKIVACLPDLQTEKIVEFLKKSDVRLFIIDKKAFRTNICQKVSPYLLKGIQIWTIVEAYESIFRKIPLSEISEEWIIENIKEKEFVDKIKRFIDCILASAMLIIIFPLWFLIALFIKLEDRGRIFYLQKRAGQYLKPFVLYKFRSMEDKADKKGPPWTLQKDKRVTKIGKILRRTHLDELPQLINILKGDISFVGPRPENLDLVKKLEKEIPFYHLRHIIKPGFTGWAQIKMTHPRTLQERLEKMEYDLYYLKNRSLFLDLIILAKTFYLLFRKE